MRSLILLATFLIAPAAVLAAPPAQCPYELAGHWVKVSTGASVPVVLTWSDASSGYIGQMGAGWLWLRWDPETLLWSGVLTRWDGTEEALTVPVIQGGGVGRSAYLGVDAESGESFQIASADYKRTPPFEYALVALGCGLWVVFRDSFWRKSDSI